MDVDLGILDLVHVEPIPVGKNTVEVNVVDTIPCRTYYGCRLDIIIVEPFHVELITVELNNVRTNGCRP